MLHYKSLRNELILYFFGYKTEIFFLPKHPKNLDPSDKTDLDLWDCLAKFHRTDSVICSNSREGKIRLIAEYILYSNLFAILGKYWNK